MDEEIKAVLRRIGLDVPIYSVEVEGNQVTICAYNRPAPIVARMVRQGPAPVHTESIGPQPDFLSMTVPELRRLAQSRDLDIPGRMTKKALIELLQWEAAYDN